MMTPEQILKDMKSKLCKLECVGELAFDINYEFAKEFIADYVKYAWENPSLSSKLKKAAYKREVAGLISKEIEKLEKQLKIKK